MKKAAFANKVDGSKGGKHDDAAAERSFSVVAAAVFARQAKQRDTVAEARAHAGIHASSTTEHAASPIVDIAVRRFESVIPLHPEDFRVFKPSSVGFFWLLFVEVEEVEEVPARVIRVPFSEGTDRHTEKNCYCQK